jgi:predicted transposase YdaD
MKRPRVNFDAIWKETFMEFFQESLERFYPTVAQMVDWSKTTRFLDKELREVLGKSPRPRQFVDFLAEVHLKTGEIEWFLVHVEVQSRMDEEFAHRIFFYHVALFRRFRRPVVSLAVLTDPDPNWRPSGFTTGIGDMGVSFQFPICKLSDFTDEELESDLNPVNFVILAERIARRHREKPEALLEGKFRLILRLARLLKAKGYSERKALVLTRVVDWSIPLPEMEEERLMDKLKQMEGETPMTYLSSFERHAMRKGLREGLEKGLAKGLEKGRQKGRQEGRHDGWIEALKALVSARFPDWKPSWNQHFESVTEPSKLQDWIRLAGTLDSGKAFLRAIGEVES